METPPPHGVSDEMLVRALGEWGCPISRLGYLPKGFGSYHWAAETEARERLFVTVDDLLAKPWLGSDADTGGEKLNGEDRSRLLCQLSELHLATGSVESSARPRTLEIPGRSALESALCELGHPWTAGPFSEEARLELEAKAEVVRGWLSDYDVLAATVAASSGEAVITHGEPHPGNLIRAGDRYRLVDWDTVALALPERDLWMLDDGTPGCLEAWQTRTGRAVDETAIACYRLAWTLTDIAAFVTHLGGDHERNAGAEKERRALAIALSGEPPRPYSAGD